MTEQLVVGHATHVTPYRGPAGVVFSHDDLLIIWAYLSRTPTAENKEVRDKTQRYLEDHGE